MRAALRTIRVVQIAMLVSIVLFVVAGELARRPLNPDSTVL